MVGDVILHVVPWAVPLYVAAIVQDRLVAPIDDALFLLNVTVIVFASFLVIA